MSEQNGDHGTDEFTSKLKEIIEKDLGGTFPALDAFDKSRGALYDELADLAVKIKDLLQRGDQASINYAGIGENFGAALRSMVAEDTSPGELVEAAVLLFKTDSDERVSMLRSLLEGDECLGFFTDEVLTGLIEHCLDEADSTEEAIQNIIDLYEYDLGNDVGVYINHLVDGENQDNPQQPNIASFEIKKSVKEHVVDVAKIAAGVTLALAADRFMRRKF